MAVDVDVDGGNEGRGRIVISVSVSARGLQAKRRRQKDCSKTKRKGGEMRWTYRVWSILRSSALWTKRQCLFVSWGLMMLSFVPAETTDGLTYTGQTKSPKNKKQGRENLPADTP